ncbi:unnamed protein product [Colias eurytheme]|nr:unnamed protein product [Colias eurytheme]
MDLDIDRFIFEIENHPAIWNTKCDEYSDRAQKVKQWEEVTNMFTDNNASVEEKKKNGILLQKRWRTLRDAFVKEQRELATTKSGSAATHKKYKYYDQLLFLLPVVSMNKTHNSTVKQENNEPVEEEHGKIIPPKPKKTKNSDPTDKIGSELLNVLKSTLQRKIDEEDCDRQFMLSLVDDFKRVPQRLKPRLKINIIKCILEAQNEEGNFQQVEG